MVNVKINDEKFVKRIKKTPYEILCDYFFAQIGDKEAASNEADNIIWLLDENEYYITNKSGLI